MPPLFPLLFALLLPVGAMTGAFLRCGPLMGAALPAAIANGALILTEWDFTVDAGAILEVFLPAFLFALTGALCGWFAAHRVKNLLRSERP
jgi:hypothetical protein